MYKYSLIYNDRVWQALEKLHDLSTAISLNEFLQVNKIDKDELMESIDFMSQFKFEINIKKNK